ncbi:hypothetical protein EFY79_20270 [Hanamia caeni]|jgi:hypothetical protein|uniref:Uncharacterized protein n=1 Tax=Hanamia caeni TaxID=2294116 RepID=A0A3M9N2Y0_9BACT|nr:hypothetical protein EFY79_20270 [Hanamia caeni]
MKYVAVTFTDKKYVKTRQRYVAELESKNIFSQIYSLGSEDFDEDFFNSHQAFIANNPKGYGFFIWKPYVIYKILKQLDEGDILVWGDAGNTIPGTREECLRKFNLVKSNKGTKIIACQEGYNIRWIKTDLYFRVKWYAILYAFKFMPAANRIVIQKDAKTMSFVKEWLELCTKDYRNIDYSHSKLPKMPFFIEHRFDQSVFAILFHLHKCTKVDFENVWLASRLRF